MTRRTMLVILSVAVLLGIASTYILNAAIGQEATSLVSWILLIIMAALLIKR